jgi:hypothetical protein
LSPRVIRRIVLVIFVGAIGGMVGGSIADNNGIAVTFGLISAVAALGLILVTSVTTGPNGPSFAPPAAFDEEAAVAMEARIEALVAEGADETVVRDLIREAVRLGRSGR